ncbi:MAG: hypothetical protein ABIZ70_13470 [Gemmatimonadales bacterium]
MTVRRRVLIGISLLGACSKPAATAAASATITTRDSAGVVIVEHPAGALSQAPRFRLGAPIVTIGGPKADAMHEATFVGSAVFVGPDRFVTADHHAYKLTLFDSTGKPLASYGRRGEGPGEFRNRPVPYRADDGSIWLLDFPGRIVRLTSDLQLRTDVALAVPPMSDQWLMPVGDGSVLAVRRAPILPQSVTEAPGRGLEYLIRLNPAGVDTLATWQGLEWYPVAGNEGDKTFVAYDQREFGKNTVVRAWGHRVAVGSNDGWMFEVRDSTGVLRQRVVLHEAARLVTETMKDSVKAHLRANVGKVHFADTVAAYSDAIAAGDGSLWVAETVIPTENVRRFAVFSAEGRLTRRVEMPARFTLLAADDDRVLVRRLDQHGVGYIDLAQLIAVTP